MRHYFSSLSFIFFRALKLLSFDPADLSRRRGSDVTLLGGGARSAKCGNGSGCKMKLHACGAWWYIESADEGGKKRLYLRTFHSPNSRTLNLILQYSGISSHLISSHPILRDLMQQPNLPSSDTPRPSAICPVYTVHGKQRKSLREKDGEGDTHRERESYSSRAPGWQTPHSTAH